MKYIKQYPLSLLVVCAIFCLHLFPLPQTEMDDIPFIDKWAHFGMYGGLCSVIWWEHVRSHTQLLPGRTLLLTVCFPILLSGAIELLQAYCTTTRNGDWADMAANAIGVALGSAVGYFIIRPLVRRWRKRKERK